MFNNWQDYDQHKDDEIIKFYIKGFFILTALIISLLWAFSAHAETQQETIASVISAEACGEGKEGMYLVANTISNRARLHRMTPYKAVTARNQYYGLTNPNRLKIWHSDACYAYSNYLANNIMNLEDKTNGAIFFLLPSEPKRSWHKQHKLTYKHHRFFK